MNTNNSQLDSLVAGVVDRVKREVVDDDFNSDWSNAPRSMRNYVEVAVAEYWYRCGERAAERRGLVQGNEDLRELVRVARERTR
jgi:hypothetical protein